MIFKDTKPLIVITSATTVVFILLWATASNSFKPRNVVLTPDYEITMDYADDSEVGVISNPNNKSIEAKVPVEEIRYASANTNYLGNYNTLYSYSTMPSQDINSRYVINQNKATSVMSAYLNKVAFNYAEKYMSQCYYLPEEYQDPLILLALSRVETGVYTDFDDLYSAAIPTVGVELNPNSIEECDAQSVIQNDAYWDRMRPLSLKHQGALQIGIDYGVKNAIAPNDLSYYEDNLGLTTRYTTEYDPIYYSPSLFSGDRYKWSDACNRVAGVLNYWYSQYSNFDNEYQFIMMAAVAHNTGGSTFTSSPTRRINSSYYPWDTVGDARAFVKQLGVSDTVGVIHKTAIEDLEAYRVGTKSQPDSGRDTDWAFKLVEESSIDSTLYVRKGSYKIHISYPVKTLYYYFLLQEAYYNAM